MIIPLKFESPLNIPKVVPISINKALFESILVEEESIATGFTTELSSNPQGWHIQADHVFLILWLACALYFGMYILLKNIKFRNAIKKEPLLTEKRVLDLLEECKVRMKIHTPLKITITNKVKSPALFGYIRPRLLLPAGVSEKLNDAELSYMFMHELGHLKRHDIGVSWIISFLQIFQWFNPFVWLAFHQMRIDQESACDASVLSRIKHDQTIDYASTIVGFLENFCRNHKLPALVGILENQTQIKKRITMIVNYRKYSKIMKFFSTALLVIVSVILFSFAGIAKQNHEQSGLEASIQPTPFELPKTMAAQDKDVVLEVEAVKSTGETQKSTIVSRKIVENDNTEKVKPAVETLEVLTTIHENKMIEKEAVKLLTNTKKISVTVQETVEKENIAPAKIKVETPEIPIVVRENNFKENGAESPLANTKKNSIAAQKIAEKENIAPVKIKVETPEIPIVVQENNIKGNEAEKLSANTKKNSITAQEIVEKENIESSKVKVETPEIPIVVRENNIKEKETRRLAEEVQKIPTEALKVSKEENSNRRVNDILKYYQYVAYTGGQFVDVKPLSGKNSIAAEDKSINNPDLGRSTYSESETSALPENKPGHKKEYNRKEDDEPPKIVKNYPLIYPFKAIAKGIEGRVILKFTVDRDGHVQNPRVVSSEPEGIFEQSALDTVMRYKWKPATKDGKSMDSVVKLPFSFDAI
jgi:TonB family protein